MTTHLNILVTAVAGDLGQAVVKALRLSQTPMRIHGCDGAPDSYAQAFVQSYHQVPLARESTYLESLDTLCRTVGIQVVVPASEPEILALQGCELPCGVPIVSQPARVLEIYADKLCTMRALTGSVELAAFADGLDSTAVSDLIARCHFPVVVKSRRSSGSRSLCIVHTSEELGAALKSTQLPVVQAYLDDSGGEFSVGVFRCSAFETAIAFKRKLGATVGLSWQAEVVHAPDVSDYALCVARAAGILGSVNVQLRLTSAGPRLLEVNPRFSSLAAARAAAGFNDAEWSVMMTLGLALSPPPQPYRHIRFQRFFHELIDAGSGFGAVPAWSPREIPT